MKTLKNEELRNVAGGVFILIDDDFNIITLPKTDSRPPLWKIGDRVIWHFAL